MKFFALFIYRPVATILLSVAITLCGVLGFRLLPVAPLPQVDFPVIMVSASLPGASPETMASSVATPLERSLGRIAGVNEMTSSSSLGSTRIILEFNFDRDINGAARDVQAAINAAQSLLPSGMPSRPTYRKANPSDAPIMILTLTSGTYSQGELYDFASTQLAQTIAQIDGVGDVDVGGSSLPAVRVGLNPQALFNQGVSLDDVRSAISNANVRKPQGAIEDSSHRWQIQTNDELKKDLKDVWKNDQWVRILLLTLCNVCPGFIRMAATMYYVTWVMQQSTHFATLFISLGVVGMMIGSMLAKVLTDRWCKLQVFFWTNIVLAIFSCAFYFFDPHATMMIMVLYFLLNILHQIPSPLHWSLMADVDDYGEWKTGKRITGISFSGNLFFLKVGLAIAGAMVGFLLSWYGYDAGAKQQSASAINGIVLLFSVIPGVGYLITAGVVRMLKVNREFMRQIQSDLEKRRINYSELNDYQELKTGEHVRKA